MIPQRLKKNIHVKLTSLKNTNVGINKRILNYINKTGIIKENYRNLGPNNVLIEMEDNISFWVSHLDIEEIQKGVDLTLKEVLDKIQKSHNISKKDAYNLCKQVFYNLKNVGTSPDEILENSEKFSLPTNIILEIYFLFK